MLNLRAIKICKRRRRSCCQKPVYCILYFVFLSGAIFYMYIMIKSQLYHMDNAALEMDKCPACFGVWENVCLAFANGELKVQGHYFWQSESFKGVWYGVWTDLLVVVKTLGTRKELESLDKEICQNVSEHNSAECNVQDAVWRSFLNPHSSFKSSVMQFIECSANHFATLLEQHLSNDMNAVPLDQKVMALTNLHFNQEFLFLQVFSSKHPAFLPKVYGSCGRAVVVEYVGPTLSSALNRPWLERIKLSIKLIEMARAFTKTENLALYMYDVVMDNFAVDPQGNVKLIDCEHILIVDMTLFNNSYVKKSEDLCSPNQVDCLTFVPEHLCEGQSQDHNYYAVCRNLLATTGAFKGLLHSPPGELVNSALLNYLLHNCVYSKQISREQAIDQLESELYKYL